MDPRPDDVVTRIGCKVGYTNFIMELRQKLVIDVVDDILGEDSGAYPVLRRQSAKPSRWLRVELQAVVGQQTFTTTLAVRGDNVYCKGFRNQRGVWYELSGRAIQNIPMLPSSWGTVEQLPECDVSYSSILRAGNRQRVEDIMRSAELGRASAETAVRRLAQYPALDNRDDYLTRLSLASLIVMVCESARFNAVFETFVGGWDSGPGLSQRLAGYMWAWKNMSHGLLQWREDGYLYPLRSQLIESAGHALAHIHLVLNYREDGGSSQNRIARDAQAQYYYNVHGKNSKSSNPAQDKVGPASKPTRGPSGSRQHSATNKKNVVSKQASGSSPKDGNAPDDPSEPEEDDRQRQSPEQTRPGDDDDDIAPDPAAGHPGEDDDDNAQGPDHPDTTGEDDDSSQGHRGNISERHGRPRVEIFALRANFHVTDMTISVFDGIRGQIIYMPKDQGEQQQPEAMEEEEMHDLALTGPYRGISAYGNFAIHVGMPSSATRCKEEDSPSTSSSGGPEGRPIDITWEWDRYNPEHAAQVDAPEPVTHAISLDSWRKIDITYLVMSNAVEATVKVKLPETPQYYLPHEMMQGDRDVDGGSKYIARGTMTAHIGGLEKHPIVLFTSAVEVPIPSESLTLPLSRSAVQVPQGKRLHIDMADLHITDCSSNREVKKPDNNDSLSYDFGHVSPTPQFNNDTEEVQVNVTWRPQQNQEKIQVEPHQVCIIGDKEEFSAFIRNLRRLLADHPDQEDALEGYRGTELASTGEHPVLTRPRAKQPTRWIHIDLQVVAGQETSSTTLAVRDDKCYGVGFASQSGVWYDLGNRRGDRALPPEYSSILLDWGVSYKDILHASTWDEVVEELHSARPGKGFAEKAVRTLSRYPYVQEGDDTRLAVAGLFIMVCESAKFNPLHEHFVQAWDSGTGFPRQLMNYIRNWGHVSRALLRWKDLGYDYDTWRHYFGQQPVGIISDPQSALDVVHLVFNNRDAPSTQDMDSKTTECEIMELENIHPTEEPVSLPLGFLRSITDDFCDDRKIGSGGYGEVYKGNLPCGSVIAVKKFNDKTLAGGDGSFEREASFFMGIEHENLVELLGFCAESRGSMMKQPSGELVVVEKLNRMLCFEYVCNGDLHKYLQDESSGLEWSTRYKIIKGICSGLKYLHEHNIIHRDLKPQNILMDATMRPKIADFGLSSLLGEQKSYTVTDTSNRPGTPGYMAPEYIDRGIISKEGDIFSLGVIIIEILKGCRDYPDYHQTTETDFQHFREKVLNNWRDRFERAPKYTALELHTKLVKQCIDIALKCVHPDKEKRPNVSNIIENLNAADGSSCDQNAEDLAVDHQMGTQEGLPPSGVLREDGLVTLNKISLKDHAQAWIAKGIPHQPQCEPVLDGYQGAQSASVWVAHNALASLESNLLKDWAATNNVAPNVNSLKLELISVKAILESTLGRVIHRSALEHSLMILQDLVYDAEDVVDEMEYFRIQDMLDDGQHVGTHNLDLNVLPSVSDEPPEMIFDRVDASNRMKHIVEQMQEVRQRISGMMTHLGSNWSMFPKIAQSRPITTSESTEPRLFGRELMMKSIIDDITKGKHSGEVLTVIPIVGPGGIGKTTLAQHIYHSGEVQEHFNVKVWTCVSLNFDVNKLIQEIHRSIPKVDGELTSDTASELIGKRLKNRRVLLVLDDIWDCSDKDQWKRLLVPFRKSQVLGNIIIVTTRFPAQAQIMVQKKDHSIFLQGLDSKEFDELFLEIIFEDDDQCRKDHTFLIETGRRIAARLKGSPLAAKTVGRLLKTQLDLVHWTRVLESKEWEQSNGKNDIMPALKLSFDYLHPHLQQCFSYCALFPQDYKFERDVLINFWIGLEVLRPSHAENKRSIEDIGLSHLAELVNYGLMEKKEEKDGRTFYIIHDLLHELAQKVSTLECLSIDSSRSQVSSLEILASIRHLSINIEDTSVNGRLILKNFVEDFSTLLTRLKVEKLRTLLLFGGHHGCFVKAFGDLFREAKALRLVFLSGVSYDVKDLLHNFYNLIHLRYLRIGSFYPYEARFPNRISRFYHMKVLDATHSDIIDIQLPRDITNLVKLRHLLVGNDTIHSSIIDVGKLKSLQELRRFVVKQDEQGFELRQIGHLEELCGSLSIHNLEKVERPEEADEAKMILKSHLQELILRWNKRWYDSALEERVLERLKPSRNLRKLSITGHTGGTCPSWLGMNLSLSSLESLCLDDVNWKTFPPIGDLLLVNVPLEKISTKIPEKRFGNLRRLELVHLSGLKTWTVHAPCQLFPYLEVLIIRDCSELDELSFSHSASCCQQGKDANPILFSRLSKLEIKSCPQLSSFPPIPWTEALHSISIQGTSSIDTLDCEKENSYGHSLTIEGKDTTDSTFWNVLDFHKLTGLTKLIMDSCESPPLRCLQMLSSLRSLEMTCSSNTFPFVEADGHAKYHFPVERLYISEWNASGKELTQLLTYFPKLIWLWLDSLEKVIWLSVNVSGQRATETPGPSSSSSTKVEQQQDAGANNNIIVASEEAERGLLLLPPQLQELLISYAELSFLRFEDGGGLHGLTSLRKLKIIGCPKLLSSYSSSSFSSSFPFPNSLEHLEIEEAVGMDALVPLSNLTSLTSLCIYECGDLRGEGLLSLLTQGHLTELNIVKTPNFFVDSKQSWVPEQELPSCSSKLQELRIDDVAGFTVAPICRSLIFSTLTELDINFDNKTVRFTEEQEALLFVNSLERIGFWLCGNLQSLPERLHTLPNLKKLRIYGSKAIQVLPNDVLPSSLQELVIDDCPQIRSLPKVCFPSSLRKLKIIECEAIQMLPEDALPSSLQELEIDGCPAIQSLPKDCLPDSLQKLEIKKCPAIRSLPKVDDLPSSLRELYVSGSQSEELRSQCRRFINIIPIVRA